VREKYLEVTSLQSSVDGWVLIVTIITSEPWYKLKNTTEDDFQTIFKMLQIYLLNVNTVISSNHSNRVS